MARSDSPTYTAADRYERRATRRNRAQQLSRSAAIRLSLQEA